MVKLKDIIGTILNDMAWARVEADIESLRIAEIYSKNELLKSMPIPRMRLKNFTVTLPIAIDKLDQKLLDEARSSLTAELVSSNSFKTLTNLLSRRSIDLSETQVRNIKSVLRKGSEILVNNKPWIMTQEKSLSDEIATLVSPFIRKLTAERLNDDELKKTIDEFRTDLRNSLLHARQFLPNLDVIVDTTSLQNVSNEEKLVHLTLNVDETGLEWSVYESTSGEVREKLVPE